MLLLFKVSISDGQKEENELHRKTGCHSWFLNQEMKLFLSRSVKYSALSRDKDHTLSFLFICWFAHWSYHLPQGKKSWSHYIYICLSSSILFKHSLQLGFLFEAQILRLLSSIYKKKKKGTKASILASKLLWSIGKHIKNTTRKF